MSATLTLVVVVIGAYLAAHVAFEWLARRFMVVSGAEYLLLGILLGPAVAGLIRPGVVGGFAPFMTLALGWIGAVIGAQFYIPPLVRLGGVYFRVALIEALATLVVVTAATGAVLMWLFPLTLLQAALPAVTLGSVATASAPSGIGLMARRLGWGSGIIRQLQVTTAVDAAVAIGAFGLLLSLVHAAPAVAPRAPTATEWAVITLGIGLVGGALFHLFLGGERAVDRLFIALAGAIILASGAAAYLRLSPLLPTMLIGAILVNTSGNRPELRDVLGRVERPLYFVLLIFAGAAWQPSAQGWVIPVLIFLAARAFAKVGGGWAGAAFAGALPMLGAGWGRALLGQGGLAIAIALNYHLHDAALYPDIVFTAAIFSVLLTDLSAARLAGAVLMPRLRRRQPAARARDHGGPAPAAGTAPAEGPSPPAGTHDGASAAGGTGAAGRRAGREGEER